MSSFSLTGFLPLSLLPLHQLESSASNTLILYMKEGQLWSCNREGNLLDITTDYDFVVRLSSMHSDWPPKMAPQSEIFGRVQFCGKEQQMDQHHKGADDKITPMSSDTNHSSANDIDTWHDLGNGSHTIHWRFIMTTWWIVSDKNGLHGWRVTYCSQLWWALHQVGSPVLETWAWAQAHPM